MSRRNAILADDYAVINAGGVRLYYGYEVTSGPDREWCFQATGPGVEVTIPFSELGARDRDDTAECLMIGIGRLIERGILAFRTRPEDAS